jgi:hypothetical protein
MEGGRRTDKLDELISKWQQETRDEIRQKGEKEFDFLNSSQGLLDRVKDHTRNFVED